MDHYQTLGVREDAPDFVIQAAYRACLRKFHPDVYDGNDAAQRTQAIVDAYKVLGNPSSRADYDSNSGASGREPYGGSQETRTEPPRTDTASSRDMQAQRVSMPDAKVLWVGLLIAFALFKMASSQSADSKPANAAYSDSEDYTPVAENYDPYSSGNHVLAGAPLDSEDGQYDATSAAVDAAEDAARAAEEAAADAEAALRDESIDDY